MIAFASAHGSVARCDCMYAWISAVLCVSCPSWALTCDVCVRSAQAAVLADMKAVLCEQLDLLKWGMQVCVCAVV